uniref:aminopeptidase N C-terminal domain-containing protein n=1 Tax=Aurantimonas coralicida TaxID=182270 RepID=UPI003517248F
LNDLLGEAMVRACRAGGAATASPLPAEIVDAVLVTAADPALEPAFRAQALALPAEPDVARMLGRDVDPQIVHDVVDAARKAIGSAGVQVFERLAAEMATVQTFSPDAESAGRRSLANAALAYLTAATNDPAAAEAQYASASNMTDRLAALGILVHRFPDAPASQAALDDFYRRFETDELVLDKWFALQATVPRPETLETVIALTGHAKFSMRNPNRVRAVIGTFAAGNQLAFHRPDGAGYRWVAERLVELDRLNPQIAARIATTVRSWRSFEPTRRGQAETTLRQLLETEHLSTDLGDILGRSLK